MQLGDPRDLFLTKRDWKSFFDFSPSQIYRKQIYKDRSVDTNFFSVRSHNRSQYVKMNPNRTDSRMQQRYKYSGLQRLEGRIYPREEKYYFDFDLRHCDIQFTDVDFSKLELPDKVLNLRNTAINDSSNSENLESKPKEENGQGSLQLLLGQRLLFGIWEIYRKIKITQFSNGINKRQLDMLKEEVISRTESFSLDTEKIRMFLLVFFQNKPILEISSRLNSFEEIYISILLLKKDYKFKEGNSVSFSNMQILETNKRKEHFIKFILKRLIKKLGRDESTCFFGEKNSEALNIMTKIFFEGVRRNNDSPAYETEWDPKKKKFVTKKKCLSDINNEYFLGKRKNRLEMLFALLKTNKRFAEFITPERLRTICAEMFLEYKSKELVGLVDSFILDLEENFKIGQELVLQKFYQDFDNRDKIGLESDQKSKKKKAYLLPQQNKEQIKLRFANYCHNLFRKKKFKIPWTYGEFIQASRMLADSFFQ